MHRMTEETWETVERACWSSAESALAVLMILMAIFVG